MAEQKKTDDLSKLSFEKALEKLEAIVSKMESGKLPLDEMMKYFEQGSALSRICESKLQEIEKKIEVLVKKTEDGGEWKAFSGDTTRSKPPRTDEAEEDDSEDETEAKENTEIF